jgi:hypothetical protein
VKSLVLHLLPGVLTLAFCIAGARLSPGLGLPTLFLLYLATVIVMIPFELGYMLYMGKRQTGRLSLQGIVLCREAMPWWQYLLLILPMLVWAFVLLSLISQPVDRFVFKSFFQWLARWFRLDPVTSWRQFRRDVCDAGTATDLGGLQLSLGPQDCGGVA